MPKVMIIDDSRVMRKIIGGAVTELGFTWCEAANGKEALTKLATEAPPVDAIFVDWNMPEMNGYEFICEIRKGGAYLKTPIMMITTETTQDQIEKALTAGANEYVMKPFTKETIGEKMKLLGVIK